MGTLALLVRNRGKTPELIQALSDDREIAVFELALQEKVSDPFQKVLDYRAQQAREDEEFGEYVEELLSQPFVRPEVQAHGVQWLKSKIRIEQHLQTEIAAAQVIAEYAYQIFQNDLHRTDFTLVGPKAEVRVRIFVVEASKLRVA